MNEKTKEYISAIIILLGLLINSIYAVQSYNLGYNKGRIDGSYEGAMSCVESAKTVMKKALKDICNYDVTINVENLEERI